MLQNEVEKILSAADLIFFPDKQMPDGSRVMSFLYNIERFPLYAASNPYDKISEFFEGRKCKLIIGKNQTKSTFSVTDTETGDTINIKWKRAQKGVERFIETTAKDVIIHLHLSIVDHEGEVLPQLPRRNLVFLHGYVLTNNR